MSGYFWNLFWLNLRSAIDQRATDAALLPRDDAIAFTASKWIWTATSVAKAVRGFRKDFTPPLGKSLIAADIIVAADNELTFWVNGDLVGSASGTRFASRFCVDLLPSFNVFAVNASTTAVANGAFIATILLTYSDGTTDTILSDTTWRSSTTVPAGFEQLSFDDTAWPGATAVGAYGAAPWSTVFIPQNPPSVSLTGATWIWTNVIPASGDLPPSSRAFRKTFVPPPNAVPSSATIIITADNSYILYVNGVEVGRENDWPVAQQYTVNLAPASEIVLAVLANNTLTSPAGLLLSMEVNMSVAGRGNCTAGMFVHSDTTWVSTKGAIPVGWELPGFNDSAWPAVAGEGAYPTATPWTTVTVEKVAAPVNA